MVSLERKVGHGAGHFVCHGEGHYVGHGVGLFLGHYVGHCGVTVIVRRLTTG